MEGTREQEKQENINQLESDISGAGIVVDNIPELRGTTKKEQQREGVDSIQSRVRFAPIHVDEREYQLEQVLPNTKNTRKKKIIISCVICVIFAIFISIIIIFDHYTSN